MIVNATEIDLCRDALLPERLTVCSRSGMLPSDAEHIEDAVIKDRPVMQFVKRRLRYRAEKNGWNMKYVALGVTRIAAGLGRVSRCDVLRLCWLRMRIDRLAGAQ